MNDLFREMVSEEKNILQNKQQNTIHNISQSQRKNNLI